MTRTTAGIRRRGVTLVEVLAAIFVMALGLMALLTLFPLGALEMAQAIKDDKTAIAAANATASARALWKVAIENNPNDPDGGFTAAMLNPNQYISPIPGPPLLPSRAGMDAPSYYVYIDPFGYLKFPTGPAPDHWQHWLAGAQGINPKVPLLFSMPRVALNSLSSASNAQVLSLFSSQDELNFGDPGAGNGVPLIPVQRDQRYSWAYLVRRPAAYEPRVLEISIVIYNGRSLQFTTDFVPMGESIYYADFTQGSTLVTLTQIQPLAQDWPPALKAGQWILDTTIRDPNFPLSTGFTPHGYFYRVVSVNQTTATTVDVEIQTPARASTPGPFGGVPSGRAVIMENVIAVIEKTPLVP
jgi:prepilin-type N-terminal cleavage/methylation domain-containing protein